METTTYRKITNRRNHQEYGRIGWDVVKYRLDQLFDLQMGKTPSRANLSYWGGENKWVSIADLSSYDKYVEDTKEHITDSAIEESGIKSIPENTVIMSFKLSLGKSAITQEAVYTNEAIMAFIDKGICELCPDYLFYLFSSMDWSKGTNKAVLGLTLNKATLSQYVIDLPGIERQIEIVKRLNLLARVISLQNKTTAKLDELIKSRFVEMFGDKKINNKKWKSERLGNCAVFRNGKAHEQVIDENGEFIIVTSKAIASDFSDVRRTNSLLSPLFKDDIVMVMSDVPNGRALAKCQLIDKNDMYSLNQRICSFSNYSFNPIFLLYLLNRHPYFLTFNDGNGQTNLRKNDILDCKLIVPPTNLQNQFADIVVKVEQQKATVQKSIDRLETLKKSLMQEYFG